MKAIDAQGLSKAYAQGKRALNGASFELEAGEVFGFLGPNGAGKTTTVKLLNGMLAPTEGSCRVFGIDPFEKPEAVHAFSGVITEHAQMYDNLTGYQNLMFYGTLYGVDALEAAKRSMTLLETLGLSDARDKKLSAYSTGMRQRLSLARAMIHRPKILFLDEPTSGLDPESAQAVNHMIKSLAQDEGITVFLCTHQLRYAEEICSSYGLIDEGVLLATGDIDALRARVFAGMTVSIVASRFPESLSARRTEDKHYEIDVKSEEEIPPVVRRIVEAGGDVYHVAARRLSLEEIYFALIEERKAREAAV
jgi:ABC-2 type transport system ATP-binding protein